MVIRRDEDEVLRFVGLFILKENLFNILGVKAGYEVPYRRQEQVDTQRQIVVTICVKAEAGTLFYGDDLVTLFADNNCFEMLQDIRVRERNYFGTNLDHGV